MQKLWKYLERTGGTMLLRSDYGCVRVTRVHTICVFKRFTLIGVPSQNPNPLVVRTPIPHPQHADKSK